MAKRHGGWFAGVSRVRRARRAPLRAPAASVGCVVSWLSILLCVVTLVSGCGKKDSNSAVAALPVEAPTAVPNELVFAGRALERSPLPCASAILIEPTTNTVLYEQGAHELRAPASIVKMTLQLVVLREIEAGRLALTDSIRVSEWASNIGGSQAYLAAGEVFSLEELMKAIVIHSANDACAAVAEHIAGTTDGFVELMNREVQHLGLTDTRYVNVHGLDDEPTQGNVTTAYDIAQIARELIRYPKVLEWSSIEKTEFRNGEFILENTNKLIGRFEGCDGLKTGYTARAGFCLCATAERDDLRLISVVMGCAANRDRFGESAELLASGFNSYSLVAGSPKPADLGQEIEIRGGKPKLVRPVLGSATAVLVSRPDDRGIVRRFVPDPAVRAPLNAGDPVGKMQILSRDKVLAELPVVTPVAVEATGLLAWFRRSTGK